MFIGTLLLVSLSSQCFSLEADVEVEILYNSSKTGFGKWTTFNSCTSRWKALTFEASTCNFTDIDAKENCPLVSEFIDVKKANELFVSVTSQSRKEKLTDKAIRGTFPLLALYGGSNETDKTVFTRFIRSFPDLSSDTLKEQFFKRNDLISFSRNQSYSQVRLGLQESVYCGNVPQIYLFYYKCPTATPNLVEFTEEAAPTNSTSPKELVGKCAKNAIESSSPRTMKCYFNGTFEIFGSCECKAGFTNLVNKCQG